MSSKLLREESTHIIPVKLTNEEIRQRSLDLTNTLELAENLKAERKAASRDLKGQEDSAILKVAQLREVVKSGVESREVACQKVYDFENGKVYFESKDGKQWSKRDMQWNEREKAQEPLFETPEKEVEKVVEKEKNQKPVPKVVKPLEAM